MLGLGLAVPALACRRGGAGGAAPPVTPAVPLASIDASGWTAQWASGTPPTFAPDSSPQTLAVTYPGFDANGAATTITDDVTITRRLRQAYPNHADLTPSTVVLSEYVPYGATIAGVANNAPSTLGYPKVIARWSHPPREALAGPLAIGVVAFQKFGRNQLPVRAVKITGTPATGSPVTKLAAYAKSARYGDNLPVWQATFTPADFPGNDGGDVRWDFEAIPWIGTASEKRSTVGVAFPSISTVGPLVSRQSPPASTYAYVSLAGDNATAVTSATRATAKAKPYATVAAALEALRAAVTGGEMSTAVIVMMAGTHTWPGTIAAGGTRVSANGWFTIEGDPDEADPFNSVTIQTSATAGPFLFNTAAGAWGFARFRNLGVTTASGFPGFVSGNGRLYVWLDNVKFTCNSGTGAWATGTRFFVTGGTGPSTGRGYSNTAANMVFDLIRACRTAKVVQANAILSTVIDGTDIAGNAMMLGDSANGASSNLIAHNVEVTNWLGTASACFSFGSDAAAPAAYRDIAIVQAAVTCSNSATSPLFALGENNAIDVDNVLLDYITVTPGTDKAGGRMNIHNDPLDVPTTSGTDQVAYTHVALKRSDCAWVAVKDDVFHGLNENDTAGGLLTAGWAKANGVGWRDNVSHYTPDNFTPDFFGLNGARGGGVASPRLIPAGVKHQALTWDIDGVARKTNGQGKAGARG
ncbi:MAG: hypothetical protein ABW173_08365 [Sphingomonas sp.]